MSLNSTILREDHFARRVDEDMRILSQDLNRLLLWSWRHWQWMELDAPPLILRAYEIISLEALECATP